MKRSDPVCQQLPFFILSVLFISCTDGKLIEVELFTVAPISRFGFISYSQHVY